MLKVNDVALVSFLLTFNISPLSIIIIAAYKQRVFVYMLSLQLMLNTFLYSKRFLQIFTIHLYSRKSNETF